MLNINDTEDHSNASQMIRVKSQTEERVEHFEDEDKKEDDL